MWKQAVLLFVSLKLWSLSLQKTKVFSSSHFLMDSTCLTAAMLYIIASRINKHHNKPRSPKQAAVKRWPLRPPKRRLFYYSKQLLFFLAKNGVIKGLQQRCVLISKGTPLTMAWWMSWLPFRDNTWQFGLKYIYDSLCDHHFTFNYQASNHNVADVS